MYNFGWIESNNAQQYIYIYTSSILYGYKIDRTTDPYGRTTLGTTHSSDTENPFNSPHLSPIPKPYPHKNMKTCSKYYCIISIWSLEFLRLRKWKVMSNEELDKSYKVKKTLKKDLKGRFTFIEPEFLWNLLWFHIWFCSNVKNHATNM